MYSQASSLKSCHSSDIKHLNEDQVFSQIKSLFSTSEIVVDSVFIELIKEIMFREDSHKIFMQTIKFFWTLNMKNIDSFIYIVINSLSSFDISASYSILEFIKEMLNDEKLIQESVLSAIPILVENIRKDDNLFTGYFDIDKISNRVENMIPLVKVLREMNTLTSNEKNLLIKSLLDMLSTVDLELCPGFVNEILLLCDKSSFQYCVGAVVNFFNQRPVSCSQLSQSSITVDSKRLISIQTVVLNHCYEIAKADNEFSKEILKLCKNNNALYSISGFMCIILLNLAGLDYIKDQILDYMANCIMNCYKDSKLFLESAFIREAVFENFDMDSLLLNAIKYCCVSEREHISDNLLNLAFILIKSGLPRSKIVTLKSQVKKKDETLINEMCNNDFNMSTPQKVGQSGIQMIIQLFKRLPNYRQLILNNIQNFILKESHKSSVFVYLELFADLISLMPMEIFNYIDEATTGQPIFELLCNFPKEVAVALVNALLPLIRYSSSIRNKLILVLMNNILSGRLQARLICVESALTLLKYLRVTVQQFGSDASQSTEAIYLTQCSQFACTQIAAESIPLPVDNLHNDEICNQILQIIDESCRQHPDTKSLIYKGLVQVIEKNFHFSGRVVSFLLEKLEFVLEETSDNSSNYSFNLSKILTNSSKGIILQEPISVLVSCLTESIRHCKANMPANDLLSTAVEENSSISKAVSKAEKTLENLLTYLSNKNIMEICHQGPDISASSQLMLTEQFIDLYEIVIVHFICSDNRDNEKVEQIFIHKEIALKADKKIKKDISLSVISLSSIIRSIRYLIESILNDFKVTNNNSVNLPHITQKRSRMTQKALAEMSMDGTNSNIVVESSSNSSIALLNEKASIYLLNKAISLVKKIGSAEYRISYRNRKETCIILKDFINICLGYYVRCLCVENVDGISSYHRQIMQLCMTLYCSSINKIIQFCTKSIDVFLNNLHEITDHLKSLQIVLGLIDSENEFSISVKNQLSMSFFVKLHKHIVSRILLLGIRKFYIDIDNLLNLTLNIAIYCGIEDARKAVASEFTYGSSRINIRLISNLNIWTYNILKSSKLHFKCNNHEIVKSIELSDSHVCRCLFYICIAASRIVMPDSVNFLEKFVADICVKIGSHSVVLQETPKVTFEFIVQPNDLLSDVINALTLALDDVDWLLFKWKCGWQEFKQRKAINNSQLSLLNSTPSDFIETSITVVTDQDRHLFEQLYPLCSMLNKLTGCSITSIPRLQNLIKLCTRIFDQLTGLVKQYICLMKSKIGSSSSNFEKLVRISGGSLSFQATQFIVYNQKIESINRNNSKENKKNDDDEDEDDDAELQSNSNFLEKKSKKSKITLDSQIGRTEKDIRLMPNLVFAIEQYQRYLIELQKISKIDFMSHVRTLNSRDFRIDLSKLQESLDKNVTMDLSDDETVIANNESEEDDQVSAINENIDELPPIKKQRTSVANVNN